MMKMFLATGAVVLAASSAQADLVRFDFSTGLAPLVGSICYAESNSVCADMLLPAFAEHTFSVTINDEIGSLAQWKYAKGEFAHHPKSDDDRFIVFFGNEEEVSDYFVKSDRAFSGRVVFDRKYNIVDFSIGQFAETAWWEVNQFNLERAFFVNAVPVDGEDQSNRDLLLGYYQAKPIYSTSVSPVPLPASALLMLTGLAGFGAMRLRRR